MSHETYFLQATGFRVWNVLELSAEGRAGSEGGEPIWHVTVRRNIDSGLSAQLPEPLPSFYATVSVADPRTGSTWASVLARGAVLELRKCLVGGARNGIETGDVHRSQAPILSYRFEYSEDISS